jgi:hypothetical protein
MVKYKFKSIFHGASTVFRALGSDPVFGAERRGDAFSLLIFLYEAKEQRGKRLFYKSVC